MGVKCEGEQLILNTFCRNGLEQRNGSVSDPESEEENEEGDYTVYECPGFATVITLSINLILHNTSCKPVACGDIVNLS